MNNFTPPPLFNIMSNEKSKAPTFTPVVLDGHVGILGTSKFIPTVPDIQGRYDKKLEKYSLSWWEPTSIFHHDALLMSAYYGMKWWNFREHFKIPKEGFLLVADSGGFQQVSTNIRIDPIKVIEWQEENADIGFILDVPPKDPQSFMPTKDMSFFIKCADQTARNVELATKNRGGNKNFHLYAILQGGDREQLKIWWKKISEFDYDGCCTSIQPADDPMQVALSTAYTHHLGFKNAHVLVGTGQKVTPVNVFAAKLFDNFTFDSSSYAVGSKFRKYFIPNLLWRDTIGFATLGGESTKIKTLPCDCPVCRIATVKDMFAEGSVSGALISLHNLYNYIKFVRMLTALSGDEEYYLKYVARYASSETARAIRCLQDYRESQDFDAVYSKYFKTKKSLMGTLR